jgi:tRNA pseudouridine55 synthase
VLLLDKPLGWTSNDALQKAKGLLRAEKGGHTGTLDPLATGLLPLCFGAATKFSQVSLDADKRYRATLHLGQRTSTGDREGEVIAERPVTATAPRSRPPARASPAASRRRRRCTRRSSTRARRCTNTPAPASRSNARRAGRHSRIDIVDWQSPLLVIDVHCSKGTYIRTLAEDIGQALACGAHLAALRRTGAGALDVAQALTIEDLAALDETARTARLLPADVLLRSGPRCACPTTKPAAS